MNILAAKVIRSNQVDEPLRGDGAFRLREECLNGFLRGVINLLVRSPSIYGHCDQTLVLPSRTFEDGFFEREQGQSQLGGPVPPGLSPPGAGSGLARTGGFHLLFGQSTDRANSCHIANGV